MKNMGTNLRPELSEKNRYWLPKHRFYELQHFCLQYPEWEKMYKTLDEAPLHSSMCKSIPVQSGFSDPTSRFAEVRIYYWERMRNKELRIKEQQLKEAKSDRTVKIILEGSALVTSVVVPSYWMAKSLTFEQTGTFLSRGLQWVSGHLRLFKR